MVRIYGIYGIWLTAWNATQCFRMVANKLTQGGQSLKGEKNENKNRIVAHCNQS